MGSLWLRPILLVALSTIHTSAVQSQAIFTRIQDPLPSELKDRAERLLKRVRPADTDNAIDETKIVDGSLWRNSGLLLMRVEADCYRNLCMTFVATVTDWTITPELTVIAGPGVVFGDVGHILWGAKGPSFPITLEGARGAGLAVFNRDGTWLVEACNDCFPKSEDVPARIPERAPAPPPPSPPIPDTFETFRRALGREP